MFWVQKSVTHSVWHIHKSLPLKDFLDVTLVCDNALQWVKKWYTQIGCPEQPFICLDVDNLIPLVAGGVKIMLPNGNVNIMHWNFSHFATYFYTILDPWPHGGRWPGTTFSPNQVGQCFSYNVDPYLPPPLFHKQTFHNNLTSCSFGKHSIFPR